MHEMVRELRSLESEANKVLEGSGAQINDPTQVDQWFQKPIAPKDLVAEIAQHLTKRALLIPR